MYHELGTLRRVYSVSTEDERSSWRPLLLTVRPSAFVDRPSYYTMQNTKTQERAPLCLRRLLIRREETYGIAGKTCT